MPTTLADRFTGLTVPMPTPRLPRRPSEATGVWLQRALAVAEKRRERESAPLPAACDLTLWSLVRRAAAEACCPVGDLENAVLAWIRAPERRVWYTNRDGNRVHVEGCRYASRGYLWRWGNYEDRTDEAVMEYLHGTWSMELCALCAVRIREGR